MTAWKITARHSETGEERTGWSGKLSRKAAELEALRSLGPGWIVANAHTENYQPCICGSGRPDGSGCCGYKDES